MRHAAPGTALVLVVVLVCTLSGCGGPAPSGAPDAVVAPDEQNLLGRWTDAAGRVLPDGTHDSGGILVVSTFAASTTCSSDGTVFLQLAWPVGTQADLFRSDLEEGDAPRFIRDTSGSAMDTVGFSDLDAVLPSSARPTGFRHEGNTISVDRKAVNVYVTRADGRTERWARLREGGCA